MVSNPTCCMKTSCTLVALLLSINCAFAQTDYEKKLGALGITLITPTKPVANYVKAVRSGNLIFLAGHGPTRSDGSNITGKVGKDLTVDQGIEAARITAIS